jgi:hypothetical protein
MGRDEQMKLTCRILILLLLCAIPSRSHAHGHVLAIRSFCGENVAWREVEAPQDESTLKQIGDTLRTRYLEPDWPYPEFEIHLAYAGLHRDVVVFLTTEYELGHTTRVFAQKGTGLHLIAEFDGSVSGIEKGLPGSIAQFIIETPPGGDNTFCGATLRAFREGPKGIDIDSIHSYSWSMETSIIGLSRIGIECSFVVDTQEYNLRTKPIIDGYSFAEEYYSNMTSFAVFGAGDKGIAFASTTDREGREWWLVVMDSQARKVRNGIGRRYLIGWMSSRYLRPAQSLLHRSDPKE